MINHHSHLSPPLPPSPPTHTSLCGTSPFLVDSVDLTKDNILSVRYSFHVKYFKEVSSNAKDLVAKMIVKEKRYTHTHHTHTPTHTRTHTTHTPTPTHTTHTH